MGKLTTSSHMYSVLIALVITAVAIPFNPGIPWFAWVGMFALMLLVAELVSAFLKTEGQHAQEGRQRTVLYFAAVAAVVLVLVLVVYFVW